MSVPINGIFNTRQQHINKQLHLKTVIHLWDSGPVLSFMTSAREQMTGIANRLDELVPCPLPHKTTVAASASFTVPLVGRPSNGDSLEHSWTRLAGLTTSPHAPQNDYTVSFTVLLVFL